MQRGREKTKSHAVPKIVPLYFFFAVDSQKCFHYPSSHPTTFITPPPPPFSSPNSFFCPGSPQSFFSCRIPTQKSHHLFPPHNFSRVKNTAGYFSSSSSFCLLPSLLPTKLTCSSTCVVEQGQQLARQDGWIGEEKSNKAF